MNRINYYLCYLSAVFVIVLATFSVPVKGSAQARFPVKGFHLDLRIQVMTPAALEDFATKLHQSGFNTLIMEWEATYPFEKHPLISNQYAYTREQVVSFVKFCNNLGIDVIPLQQSFGHVEYILRHYKYKELREDQKDYSQVCPVEEALNKSLFTDLYTELAATHNSPYIHIGGDETYLLGHCPKCVRKAAEVGKSRLYIDHIKMLCDIVIRLGKRPVLWADIALKYPEAIHLLPKETVFIDWNYGWDMNKFGDHEKLLQAGYEIWGAPALRSSPDNFYLTQWEKHFNNIRDFVPAAAKLGYKGIIMTSWSTSGIYSPVFLSSSDVSELYAIRHVYPLSGFNMLLAAFAESVNTPGTFHIRDFVAKYCKERYGFTKEQSDRFWVALTKAPYDISQGVVTGGAKMSVKDLCDSAKESVSILSSLHPVKNSKEFDHYKLMAAIRLYYLKYSEIEFQANAQSFERNQVPALVKDLEKLKDQQAALNNQFNALNKGYLYPREIEEENMLRNIKIDALYKRLAGQGSPL